VAWGRDQWPATQPFWQDVLDGAPSGFAVPGRREARHFSARSVPVYIPAEFAAGLRAAAAAHGVTPYMVVLAAWVRVLAGWTGMRDMVVMSPVPGRTRPELDGVVGCLVQSLLLRVHMADGPFWELVGSVRDVALAAAAHQHYPYEGHSRRIRYPAWFRYESWERPAHIPGLLSEPFDLPRELSFDWPLPDGETDIGVPELALGEQEDGSITGWLVFNRLAFDRPAVEPLAAALLRDLRGGADV
jgi:non-ribosomal peptide synthetase component F